MTDPKLIRRMKNSDMEAFDEIYHSCWKKVYNFCRLYLRNKESAEEAVQEVFTRVWEIREIIREEENFEGLLFILSRNIIFKTSRRKLNLTYIENIFTSVEKSESSLEESIEASSLHEVIDSLVDRMPVQRQTVYRLSRERGMTYREISCELNIAEKTVERHINEALKTIRKILLTEIFTS